MSHLSEKIDHLRTIGTDRAIIEALDAAHAEIVELRETMAAAIEGPTEPTKDGEPGFMRKLVDKLRGTVPPIPETVAVLLVVLALGGCSNAVSCKDPGVVIHGGAGTEVPVCSKHQ